VKDTRTVAILRNENISQIIRCKEAASREKENEITVGSRLNKALAKRSRKSTHVRTCELAMGGQTDSQVDASLAQVAKKPFNTAFSASAPVQRKTIILILILNLKNERLLPCKFELDQSERKSSQVS